MYKYESRFQFTSECFTNETTVFHYVANTSLIVNSTKRASLAVNN